MGLLSPCGSQITTTTVAHTVSCDDHDARAMLACVEFFFCFDQGIGSRSAAWASRVDVVWVSICDSSVVRCCSHVWCLMYSWGICMPFVCIPNYYVMVWCNDFHLAKRLQYAALSLVGPLSSFRIESDIGRGKLVSDPWPTIGAPLFDHIVWTLSSLEENFVRV